MNKQLINDYVWSCKNNPDTILGPNELSIYNGYHHFYYTYLEKEFGRCAAVSICLLMQK